MCWNCNLRDAVYTNACSVQGPVSHAWRDEPEFVPVPVRYLYMTQEYGEKFLTAAGTILYAYARMTAFGHLTINDLL